MFNNDFNEMIISEDKQTLSLKQYVVRIFAYMFLGLALSTIAGYIFVVTGLVETVATNTLYFLGIIGLEFFCVIKIGSRMSSMHQKNSLPYFIAYSVVTGITFGMIGIIYDPEIIILAVGLTCAYFGSLCVIGYTTKADLTKLGTFCMISLVIFVLLRIVGGLFFQFSADSTLISMVGILIFTGLTAYDMQKAKKLYYMCEDNQNAMNNSVVFMALQLYLDFVNIFLYILRLLASNND